MESAAEVELARTFLLQSEYNQMTVCGALGMQEMSALGQVNWDKILPEKLPTALYWCIWTFARGLPTETRVAEEICGRKALQAFLSLGLLAPSVKNPTFLVCPVWLYPVGNFVVASDRRDDPDVGPVAPATDVVFPAIYSGTLRFLELLPEVHGGDALDLCGGSGIGALQLCHNARSCVTTDVAERSALFAAFNARLNDIPVESYCGDLYAPVVGRQFDVISAHPPFVPATGPTMIYRDAGETGEAVTRRIIEGLPAALRLGGTAVVLCVACDREQKTFEQSAREWLGEARDEFDLVFGLEKVLSVNDVVGSLRKHGQQITGADALALHDRFRMAGIRQFVYGALFLRRHGDGTAEEPARIRLAADGRAADFMHLLDWRHFKRQPGFLGWLGEAHPRLASSLTLTVRHVIHDGDLVPAEFLFSIEKGIAAVLRPEGWVVPLAARLNGKPTVREVFETAQAADELPAGFTLEAFMGLVERMLDLGLLTVPERAHEMRPE